MVDSVSPAEHEANSLVARRVESDRPLPETILGLPTRELLIILSAVDKISPTEASYSPRLDKAASAIDVYPIISKANTGITIETSEIKKKFRSLTALSPSFSSFCADIALSIFPESSSVSQAILKRAQIFLGTAIKEKTREVSQELKPVVEQILSVENPRAQYQHEMRMLLYRTRFVSSEMEKLVQETNPSEAAGIAFIDFLTKINDDDSVRANYPILTVLLKKFRSVPSVWELGVIAPELIVSMNAVARESEFNEYADGLRRNRPLDMELAGELQIFQGDRINAVRDNLPAAFVALYNLLPENSEKFKSDNRKELTNFGLI